MGTGAILLCISSIFPKNEKQGYERGVRKRVWGQRMCETVLEDGDMHWFGKWSRITRRDLGFPRTFVEISFKLDLSQWLFVFLQLQDSIGSHSEIRKQATIWVNSTFLVKWGTTETFRAGEDSPRGKGRQMPGTWQVVNKTTPASLKALHAKPLKSSQSLLTEQP